MTCSGRNHPQFLCLWDMFNFCHFPMIMVHASGVLWPEYWCSAARCNGLGLCCVQLHQTYQCDRDRCACGAV